MTPFFVEQVIRFPLFWQLTVSYSKSSEKLYSWSSNKRLNKGCKRYRITCQRLLSLSNMLYDGKKHNTP